MKSQHRQIIHTTLLTLLALWASASNAVAGGSIYSRFGIGDLVYFGGSRSDAMGGVAIGLAGDGFINRLNPAGLARIARTRVSGSFEYSNTSSTDKTASGEFGRGEFKALALAIPISTDNGIVLQLGTSPYSTVQYATEISDDKLKQTFFGTGGISAFSLGGSYAPWKGILTGARFDYLFGRVRQVAKYEFSDVTFTSGEFRRSRFYSGVNFTFGATIDSIGSFLNSRSLDPLTIGIVMSTSSKLSIKGENLVVSNQITDTLSTNEETLDLPSAIGAGFSYLTGNRYVLAGDIYFQRFGSANFSGTPTVELKNRTRVALGLEILPERGGDSFWQRVAYRAGISYHSTYYRINGQSIDEVFVSGGLGIPVGPDARMNLSLHGGMRGSSSNGLQRDTIVRLTISLTASEAWFLRFEED